MRIVCVGGGPAGLYFALLVKKADPSHDILVLERNRPDDTFGFGVVFSDATLGELSTADPPSYRAITDSFYHWDDIDIHYAGQVLTSTGHGFSGLARQRLLDILHERCRGLGVELRFGVEVDDPGAWGGADLVLGADGINSSVRSRYAEALRPSVDLRPNRFVWLGTTRPFPAFTFDFVEDRHGLWRLHAYQYRTDAADGGPVSTFIVETTAETFAAAGLDPDDEAATVAFCERLFEERLGGHGLVANRSIWRRFPTVRTERWSCGNTVLVGDAAHTAHFSVGSGTRMAMVDAIRLRDALAAHGDVRSALAAYEEDRRPEVESLQRAAQASLEWFEDAERYMDLHPLQLAYTLVTRSLRITHADLAVRDPAFLERVDRWFAREAERQVREERARWPPRRGAGAGEEVGEGAGGGAATGDAGGNAGGAEARPPGRSASASMPAARPPPGARPRPVPPPMFTRFRIRDMELVNRVVVSPMCQYCAVDGTVDDWHLVHLGSRAVGGAGLVMAEMTDVSREARISTGCAGLYAPEHVGAWKRIVDFVHGASPAKIGIQLGHAGRKGATKFLWEGGESEPLEEGEWELVAPSPIPYVPERSQTPREMSRSDMDEVLEDYVRAAEYALEADFDLLEVHMAHGYLLATFISPLTNEREDAYGGPLENRMRYPLEVFDAVRAAWPDEKPLSVRISATDWAPGGMTGPDSAEVARMLKRHGCDLVDVSAGQTVQDQRPRYGRLFQTPFSDRIRHQVGIHTMAVGNISSWMDVNTILAAGRADLCLLARAHLFDPYWTRHAAWQQGWPMEWPPQYRSVQRYTPRFEFRFTGDEG